MPEEQQFESPEPRQKDATKRRSRRKKIKLIRNTETPGGPEVEGHTPTPQDTPGQQTPTPTPAEDIQETSHSTKKPPKSPSNRRAAAARQKTATSSKYQPSRKTKLTSKRDRTSTKRGSSHEGSECYSSDQFETVS